MTAPTALLRGGYLQQQKKNTEAKPRHRQKRTMPTALPLVLRSQLKVAALAMAVRCKSGKPQVQPTARTKEVLLRAVLNDSTRNSKKTECNRLLQPWRGVQRRRNRKVLISKTCKMKCKSTMLSFSNKRVRSNSLMSNGPKTMLVAALLGNSKKSNKSNKSNSESNTVPKRSKHKSKTTSAYSSRWGSRRCSGATLAQCLASVSALAP